MPVSFIVALPVPRTVLDIEETLSKFVNKSICSFIHLSVNEDILSIYYVPDSAPGTQIRYSL